MASSYTTSARFTLQATGENNNTWGVILNSGVFQLVDDNVNGRLAFNLSGVKVLTTNLGATDEARMAFLDVLGGTGGTITVPAVSQGHFVRNAAAGPVTVSAGGLATAVFTPGEAGAVFSDGSNVYPMLIGGKTVKKYVDDLFSSVPAVVPPVAGQAGKFLGNDGVGALAWQTSTPLTWTFGGAVINAGPTAPPAPIDASVALQITGATGSGPRLEMNSFGLASPQINARRANGTAAAPTALLANDDLAVFSARGYGATGFSATNRASLVFTASENWTDAAQGAEIRFFTTPIGTVAHTPRWKITEGGHFAPFAANASDVGSAALPIRNFYGGSLASVNLGPTAAPAPIDAGVGLQITGATNVGPRIELNAFGAANTQFNGRMANGTAAAPTATQVNNAMLVLGARGYGATGFSAGNRGSILFSATENWTDAAQGTDIQFQTTTNGTAAAAGRWRVTHDGHWTPAADNTYDIGNALAKARNIQAAGTVVGGTIHSNGTVITVPRTVATLDAGAIEGARCYVTDATSAVFGAAVVGGGVNRVPVYRDNVGWKVG